MTDPRLPGDNDTPPADEPEIDASGLASVVLVVPDKIDGPIAGGEGDQEGDAHRLLPFGRQIGGLLA